MERRPEPDGPRRDRSSATLGYAIGVLVACVLFVLFVWPQIVPLLR